MSKTTPDKKRMKRKARATVGATMRKVARTFAAGEVKELLEAGYSRKDVLAGMVPEARSKPLTAKEKKAARQKARKERREESRKRLQALKDPQWVDAMVTLITGETWFRWHDSGDLQGPEHLQLCLLYTSPSPRD